MSNSIFEEVSSNLGDVSPEMVEIIYKDYVKTLSKEMSKSPDREMYLPKFGKIAPSIIKIKKRLRMFFKLRHVEKTQKMINTIRSLRNNKNKRK
jgi:hypothetical protein